MQADSHMNFGSHSKRSSGVHGVLEVSDSPEPGDGSCDQEYIHLFVNDHQAIVDYLEHLLSSTPGVGVGVHNTLLEYHLYAYREATGHRGAGQGWDRAEGDGVVTRRAPLH